MNTQRFNDVVAEQIKRSTDVLCSKAKEYATEDRLHNFKVAAVILDGTPVQALMGMMSKHTVSIYDMCQHSDPNDFTMDMWNEKITDSINYLLLLKAIVVEAEEQRLENRIQDGTVQ